MFSYHQELALALPLGGVLVAIGTANYRNATKPVLSCTLANVYRFFALVLGCVGLFGAFGLLNWLVTAFHEISGSYIFSGIILGLWANGLKGKSLVPSRRQDA